MSTHVAVVTTPKGQQVTLKAKSTKALAELILKATNGK